MSTTPLASRKLVSNLSFLFILQLTNYALPLVVIPYLLRVIGSDRFGIISLAQSVAAFFIVIVDYGFSFTATRRAAHYRDDPAYLQQLYATIFTTKVILTLAGAILYTAIVLSVPRFSAEQPIFFISYILVLAQATFPLWLFQGLEDMRYITYLQVSARIIFAAGIFIFVRSINDAFIVPLAFGVGGIVGSIAALILIRRKYALTPKWASFLQVKEELRYSFPIFVSLFFGNANVYLNLIILSFFANDHIVGYFSVADRVIVAIRQLLSVIANAIYPHLVQLAKGGFTDVRRFFLRFWPPLILLVAMGCILLAVLAEPVLKMAVGAKYISEMANVLKYMAPVPFLIICSIPLSTILLVYDHRNAYSLVQVAASFFNLVINLVLVSHFGMYGTAISICCTETILLTGFSLVLAIRYPQHNIFARKRN